MRRDYAPSVHLISRDYCDGVPGRRSRDGSAPLERKRNRDQHRHEHERGARE